MDSLELPPLADHHIFYLSSCESGTGVDLRDSSHSSRHSSSSFSSSNGDVPTPNSSAEPTNIFLRVLRRLHCFTVRRQKHGRYRTLSSSLHLFFKKPHHSSNCQFYKSPSSPQFPATNPQIEKIKALRKNHSHHHLQRIDTNQQSDFPSKNGGLNASRSFLARVRRSDKTVSEDNNTNTLSSLDLAILPPIVLVTDSTSLGTLGQQQAQQQSSNDLRHVSFNPHLQTSLSQCPSNRFPFPLTIVTLIKHVYFLSQIPDPLSACCCFAFASRTTKANSQTRKIIDLRRHCSMLF